MTMAIGAINSETNAAAAVAQFGLNRATHSAKILDSLSESADIEVRHWVQLLKNAEARDNSLIREEPKRVGGNLDVAV